MGTMKFTFVQDSRAKLVCISHSGTSFTRYSFDGREGEFSKKLRLFDDINQFTFERGVKYLQQLFDRELSGNDWRSVLIADKDYPQSGEIVLRYDKYAGCWSKDKPQPSINPTTTTTPPQYFIFKLWVPVYDGAAKVFFSHSGLDTETGEFLPRVALLSILSQYHTWVKNYKPRIQAFGKVYGNGSDIYEPTDSPPCLYYFDTKTADIFYHNTKRRIKLLESAIQIYDVPGL